MIRLPFLLVILLTVAFPLAAQDASGEAEETPDCIPAPEVEQSDDAESGPTGEEDTELPLCEDEAPAEETEEPPPEDEEVADEEDELPIEDVDIEPEDEISEDYPVPLPSDI